MPLTRHAVARLASAAPAGSEHEPLERLPIRRFARAGDVVAGLVAARTQPLRDDLGKRLEHRLASLDARIGGAEEDRCGEHWMHERPGLRLHLDAVEEAR